MKAIFIFSLLSGMCFLCGCTENSTTIRSPTQATESTPDVRVAISPKSDDVSQVVTIQPGAGAEKQAQEALILAEPGDIIEFAEGTFEFKGTLSLNGISDITIRGKGIDKSILNFTGQRSGSGLTLNASTLSVSRLKMLRAAPSGPTSPLLPGRASVWEIVLR